MPSDASVKAKPAAERPQGGVVEPKTRVLAVIRHPVGGIRTYIRYVYPHLPTDLFEFTFVTIPANEPFELSDDLPHAGTRVVPASGGNPIRALFASVVAELRSGRHDVIHSHGFTAGAIASLANVFYNRPHVVTSHAMLSAADFGSTRGWLKARMLTWLLSRATYLQSVSHDAEANLLQHLRGLVGHPGLVVIPTGVTLGPIAQPSGASIREWRDAHDIRPETSVLGFVGRIMPEKGFETVIDAVDWLQAHERRPFVVAVAGDGGYIRERRAEIERRGLSTFFRFLGFHPDPVAVLTRMDAVVMPSLSEACGLVAIETLITGRPLIASSCPGLREVVSGTPAMTVPPGDAQALGEAIRRMLDDRPRLEAEAGAYAATATSRFDARSTAAELARLLRGSAAQPTGA